MARVKKVSRRPAASGGGLAGAPQLDLAYAYAIEQIGQIWREENIRPDPDFVAGRALTQMMPPTPAAAEQGCEEEPNPKKRKASALSRPEPKSQEGLGVGVHVGMQRCLLSSSSPDPRYRILTLQATLQILQEEHKKLEREVTMKGRRSGVWGTEPAEESETKKCSEHVMFVHYDAKQKERKEMIQEKLGKLGDNLEVAKAERDKTETERLRARMKLMRGLLKDHEQDGDESDEGDEQSVGEEGEDLEMGGTES